MSFIGAPNATYPTNWPTGQVGRWTGAEIHSDPTGLTVTSEKFSGYYNDMVTNNTLNLLGGGTINRTYLSPHPDFPSLLAFGVKITRRPGLINGLMSIEYRGLDPALSYPPLPIYSTEESTSSEPIQNHPLFFTSQMAGTATTPANGAIFTDVAGNTNPAKPGGNPSTYDPTSAVFTAWAASSIFSGETQYEAPCIVFKTTYTSYGLPALANAGTFSSPDGPAPSPPDGSDWWFVGGTAEDNAGLYRCSLTWKTKVSNDGTRVIYGG